MLTQNDKEYIKLLYDNFLKINLYIKSAIENEDLEQIENIFQSKNQLIKEIVSFEKIHHEEIKKDEHLLKYKLDLIEKEKENIKLLENIQLKAKSEINQTSKTKKLYNAYEPTLNQTHSTIEILDDSEE